MARACSICTHEHRPEIDAAIAAGKPHRAIGRDFGVGNEAVTRHAANHGPGSAPPTAEGTVAEPPTASATAVVVPVVVHKPTEPLQVQSRARGTPTANATPAPPIATDFTTAPEAEPAAARALSAPAPATSAPLLEVDDADIPRCPPDRAARVDAIERMMLALAWDRGKTGPRVAKAWGLTLAAVESYSSEAARNIRRAVDPQAMKGRLAKALDDGIQQAFATGEVKAVASLVKTYADMLGLIQNGKVQVNILQTPPVQDFIGAAVAFMAALCPGEGETIDAWLAAARDDVDGARSDPAGWLERRRGTITVEAEG